MYKTIRWVGHKPAGATVNDRYTGKLAKNTTKQNPNAKRRKKGE